VTLKPLGSLLRVHLLFAADDIAGIHTPTDFIHCCSQTANATLIIISLLQITSFDDSNSLNLPKIILGANGAYIVFYEK
jgi:hypothetical protein